jgi:foldase protein PrsA
VNGQPISRLSVISQLEQQSGDQALQALVTQTLIQQEASKRNITISQNDVNNQIKTIQNNLSKQGQTLSAALQAQHMTQKELEDQIKLQLMVEKMVGPVKVTDKQILDYMNQNKASLPATVTPSQVAQQLQQQNLQQKEQEFVSGLQSKSHVTYWVSY